MRKISDRYYARTKTEILRTKTQRRLKLEKKMKIKDIQKPSIFGFLFVKESVNNV